MEYFLQQLINGITLGSIYGLIAIGYTMVYGIIGMINFAHGDVFMVGGFVSLIAIVAFGITGGSGFFSIILALVLVVLIAMIIASAYNWTIERVAYRPLRGSFRLAPLISAIGMSIVLQEFVRIAQDGRPKPLQPIVTRRLRNHEPRGGPRRIHRPAFQHADLHHSITTLILMAVFTCHHSPAHHLAGPSAPASRT